MGNMNGWGHPDRDALLYFEVASGLFEEAGELFRAGDVPAARDSIRQGIKTVAVALRLATTSKGRSILEEALEFWTGELAALEGEGA